MKIFVTAIEGFLGSAIAAHFRASAHDVSGSARRATGLHRLELAAPFDPSIFDGVDVLIHCAHDFTAGAFSKNSEGTKAWLDAAAIRRVNQQVFISSHSASETTESEYGRTKATIEDLFLRAGQCVVRPGLVIGKGGLFQRQRTALLRTPIVPMIDGGTQPTAVIGLMQFLAALTAIVDGDLRGALNLFHEPQPTYREFVAAIKRSAGQRPRFLNVSYRSALAVTTAFEKLKLPFPVKPGQISALAANVSQQRSSDLYALLKAAPASFSLDDALHVF